jgi:hypothetical protein
MMTDLPPHIALADEPIEPLRDRPWDGPDMAQAMPIEMMLGLLRQLKANVPAYLALWLRLVKSVGGYVSLTVTREGDENIGIVRPCDAQIRHRSRWLHYLEDDLFSDPDRHELLVTLLMEKGHFADNRPAKPRAVTAAVRDYLLTDGRILIDPAGNLTEGGEIPKSYAFGTDAEAAECARATRAYHAIRKRWRSDAQIKRAVRMLGRRTDNGWLVLQRPSADAEDRRSDFDA